MLKVSQLLRRKCPMRLRLVFDKSALQNAKRFRHNLKGCPGARRLIRWVYSTIT